MWSTQIGVDLLKLACYWGHSLIPYNFCVFALNARIAQPFDEVIMIGNAGHLIEQRNYRSRESIDAIKTWLQAIVLDVFSRVGEETFF